MIRLNIFLLSLLKLYEKLNIYKSKIIMIIEVIKG